MKGNPIYHFFKDNSDNRLPNLSTTIQNILFAFFFVFPQKRPIEIMSSLSIHIHYNFLED